MKTGLVTALNREAGGLIRALDRNPAARRLFEGTITAAAYARFLVQTYHYVRWTRPLLARAGERLQELGEAPVLAELLLRKAEEETGHEHWVRSDIEALGVDVTLLDEMAPSAAVQAYLGWNRFTVEAGVPTAFLGTAYVLEVLSVERAGQAVENLIARSEIPRIREAVWFLRGHAGADGPHVAHLASLLDDISDRSHREAIALSARVTRSLYPALFTDSGSRSQSSSRSRSQVTYAVTCDAARARQSSRSESRPGYRRNGFPCGAPSAGACRRSVAHPFLAPSHCQPTVPGPHASGCGLDPQALRDHSKAGSGRHGGRVPGPRHVARPPRRHQGSSPAARSRRRTLDG